MKKPDTPKRKKISLGRGLASLIPENDNLETLGETYAERNSFTCDITLLTPSKFQPRKVFGDDEIDALADSIKEQGIIQPLIVRKHAAGYEIIAGERRLRAAKKIGLKEVPVVVRDADDHAVLEMALVENIQREDLNALEEALAIERLISTFGLTQDDAATRLGRSRSAVANTLRLLTLPMEIKEAIARQKLSAGHARAILALDKVQAQVTLAKKVVKDGLSVRQTEDLVKKAKTMVKASPAKKGAKTSKDSDAIYFESLASDLSSQWGTKIEINRQGKKGKLVIEFYNDKDLDNLIKKLKRL